MNAGQKPTPSQLSAYLMQVGHSLNLVAELPEWLEQANLPKHLRHAAAESFALNCRLLVEFFWDAKATDISVHSYVLTGRIRARKPKRMAGLADKHVAHFSTRRIDQPLVTIDYHTRSAVRRQLLDAADDFAELLRDRGDGELMSSYVRHARSLATWPPPPTDGEDPSTFIEAISDSD